MHDDKANEAFKSPCYVVLFWTVTTTDAVVYVPPRVALTVSPSYIPITAGFSYHIIRFILTLCGKAQPELSRKRFEPSPV